MLVNYSSVWPKQSTLAISLSTGVMKGDFERAVRGELAVMYRVARRLTNSGPDAEDLVQQTLLRAFTAWDRFDGAKLRPWLLRILSNENLARFRGPAAPQQFSEDEHDQPFENNLWETVLTRDQVQRILCNLDKLETHYKLAVQLCDVEGLSYEEAAQALDVPMGTIRSRLFRGRAMLRELVLNDGGDNRE